VKIKKGDRVRLLSGKDKGAEGVVMIALPTRGKVVVDGANLAKKHQRPTRMGGSGGIIDKAMPIDVSNVAILCPKDGPTRIGYKFDTNGDKARICKKCGNEI
jgi:large subunit ribosomal protein L24